MNEEPTKEYTIDQEILRGANSKRLLENPLYNEAWKLIRQSIHDAFESCSSQDTDTLVSLKMAINVTNQLEGYFNTLVETGKMAQIQFNTQREEDTQRVGGMH